MGTIVNHDIDSIRVRQDLFQVRAFFLRSLHQRTIRRETYGRWLRIKSNYLRTGKCISPEPKRTTIGNTQFHDDRASVWISAKMRS